MIVHHHPHRFATKKKSKSNSTHKSSFFSNKKKELIAWRAFPGGGKKNKLKDVWQQKKKNVNFILTSLIFSQLSAERLLAAANGLEGERSQNREKYVLLIW